MELLLTSIIFKVCKVFSQCMDSGFQMKDFANIYKGKQFLQTGSCLSSI